MTSFGFPPAANRWPRLTDNWWRCSVKTCGTLNPPTATKCGVCNPPAKGKT